MKRSVERRSIVYRDARRTQIYDTWACFLSLFTVMKPTAGVARAELRLPVREVRSGSESFLVLAVRITGEDRSNFSARRFEGGDRPTQAHR